MCQILHFGKMLISFFKQFFANIGKLINLLFFIYLFIYLHFPNADLEISLCVCVLSPNNSRVICSWGFEISGKVGLFLAYSVVSGCLWARFLHIWHALLTCLVCACHRGQGCFGVWSSPHCFHVRFRVLHQFCLGVPSRFKK